MRLPYAFRRAAHVEHRLLPLEDTGAIGRVPRRVWVRRLARLIALRPELRAWRYDIVAYLVAVEGRRAAA